jgi:hypothetical protein
MDYLKKVKQLKRQWEQAARSSEYGADLGQEAPGLTHYERNEENEESPTTGAGPVGDGQPPPLGRPPATEMELRRLIDHLADPEAFTRWLEWAMSYMDPAEGR